MEVTDVDPLQFVPEDKWVELEPTLKLDWPRSIAVINLLDALRRYPHLIRIFNFKVYCPYGDVTIGIVTTCMKKSLYEVIMHCNRNIDTYLKAVTKSNKINWDLVSVQFSDRHLMESVSCAMKCRNVETCHFMSCDTLYFDANPYEIQLPPGLRFGLLSMEHLTLVNSMWEHRYPDSDWYFEQLIESKLGYGLFEKDSNKLIAWVFYLESGTYGNNHVLESYRNRGYGELLAKIAYNIVRKEKEYLHTFCIKGNAPALRTFQKLGVEIIGETFWTIFITKTKSKI